MITQDDRRGAHTVHGGFDGRYNTDPWRGSTSADPGGDQGPPPGGGPPDRGGPADARLQHKLDVAEERLRDCIQKQICFIWEIFLWEWRTRRQNGGGTSTSYVVRSYAVRFQRVMRYVIVMFQKTSKRHAVSVGIHLSSDFTPIRECGIASSLPTDSPPTAILTTQQMQTDQEKEREKEALRDELTEANSEIRRLQDRLSQATEELKSAYSIGERSRKETGQ